jgi:hypothetical protein
MAPDMFTFPSAYGTGSVDTTDDADRAMSPFDDQEPSPQAIEREMDAAASRMKNSRVFILDPQR